MDTYYMLCIANKNSSSWSLRPWLAMRMAGIAFTEQRILLRQPDIKERIAKVSPSGKLPVLLIEEKGRRRAVWDSLAICEAVAERHLEARLWPEESEARAEARSAVAEMHADFLNLRRDMSMDLSRAPAPIEQSQELQWEIARIFALWNGLLERYSGAGGFLFGRFSIVDCLFAPVLARFHSYSVTMPGPARPYAERLLALAPMKEWEAAAKEETKTA